MTMKSSGLKIAHRSKTSFITLLKHIIYDIGVREVHVSDKKPMRRGIVSIANESRIDITLSGRKQMSFASKGGIRDVVMEPGDIHYCPPLRWKFPRWDCEHEMSGIVFYPSFYRITYINFTKRQYPRGPERGEIFYHTHRPLSADGKTLLRTVNLFCENQNNTGMVELIVALLKNALEELRHDEPSPSKGSLMKSRVERYLMENFRSPINRTDAARALGVSTGYVSQLFSKSKDEGFNQKLRRLRLEHAVLLLTNTRMSIDEITQACGFLSSTYFIAAFKRSYGVTPGKYRRMSECNV